MLEKKHKLRRLNQKGFTLIELLVVVAIIGILAAVGVVAYSGYTSSAKASVAKDNHKTVFKFIQTSFMKCEMGEKLDLNVGIGDICGGSVNAVAGSFAEYFRVNGMNNPYGDAKGYWSGIRMNQFDCSGSALGSVCLKVTGDDILVETEWKQNTRIKNTFYRSDR